MKILIVDDSKAMRMIVLRTLRQSGLGSHEFVEATNGAEGLQLALAGGIDAVLSDWNMPEMNGLEFLKALRAAGSNVTFGFITSESNEDMKKAAMDAGAGFLITKPFSADDVTAALGPFLKK